MEDFEVEDIVEDLEKRDKRKKKLNSKKKGNRTELGLVKLLNSRFAELLSKHSGWGQFSRSVGSGNRWGQSLNLPKHAKDTFTGDLTCPTNFKFVIESKGGYNDVDLCGAFVNGDTTLDGFLKQVSDDAKRSSRKPLLIWKKDRKPHLAVLKMDELPNRFVTTLAAGRWLYFMMYREWCIINLDRLLELPDDFFFDLDAVNG